MHASLLSQTKPPEFAKNSFVMCGPPGSSTRGFKAKDSIINYVSKTFKEKTNWNTKIEKYSANAPSAKFNLISINNVLMYIDDYGQKVKTMENLARMLKPNGILVTDTYDSSYKFLFRCLL